MRMDAYLIDIGVLLEEDDEDFDSYNCVYDQKYGYYDEGQYYLKNKEKAIKDAKKYVEDGVDYTYAIVSKTTLPDDFDFDEGYVEDEEYSLENVVYAIAKINGEIVENFLEKQKVK